MLAPDTTYHHLLAECKNDRLNTCHCGRRQQVNHSSYHVAYLQFAPVEHEGIDKGSIRCFHRSGPDHQVTFGAAKWTHHPVVPVISHQPWHRRAYRLVTASSLREGEYH